MAYYLRFLRKIIAKLIEGVRGERTVFEITEPRATIESLVAYAVEGYNLTIHCRERKFLCKYSRWYVPDRILTTYDVFATVAGKAPTALMEAATDDRTFPMLLENYSSSRAQKEAAIEAFVDLMKDHLRTKAPPIRSVDIPLDTP